MTTRRRILIGIALAVAVVAAVTAIALARRSRDRAYLADAAPAVQFARDFMTDALAGRIAAAAVKLTPSRRFAHADEPAREIEQQLQTARVFAPSGPEGLPGPTAPVQLQQYMPIYRRYPDSGHLVWRVDAKITLTDGNAFYAQFAIVRPPGGTAYVIDIWNIDPWPKSGFTLGDASSDPYYPDVQWAPGTREVRSPRR